mmetsp:Transcript_25960/g.62337  ORF Transcript_25960/g.62337 Transcript_25960/m.62337 type:complete len:277 (-) Transcript_25960:231-1061(-)
MSLIPRHCALDIDEVPPPIDLDNSQILFGHPDAPHPTRHFLAFEYPPRILTHARTTNRTMTLTRTVRRRHTLEPVPFHPPLKSLPLANSRNIDILPRNEVPGMNLRPRLRHGILRGHPELPHDVRRMLVHAILGIMSHERLRDVLRLALSRADLHRVVTIDRIARHVFDDDVAVQEEDRAGMAFSPPVPDGRHSQFDGQGAAALVPERPLGRAARLLLEVLEAVRHDQRTLALARLPIPVFLAYFFLLDFLQLLVDDCLDLVVGEVRVDGVDFVRG